MATDELISTDTTIESENSLSDLVRIYAVSKYMPPADWITHLKLERPRHDIRSVDERTRLIKRLVDIFVSATMLVLLFPLMAFFALLVKLTSPGPVIFQQVRTGLNLRRERPDRRGDRHEFGISSDERRASTDRRKSLGYGKPFVLYKFRTMRNDAEKNGAQFAVQGDPRVTTLGRFMRKTRIDELPQLWNVLKGEMSLVGPRPERPEFIEKLSDEIPDYLHRLGLKPGLTGPAQVINGYDNDIAGFRRKVALDLLYLQNCCFWNDVKILARTVLVVFTGKGAL